MGVLLTAFAGVIAEWRIHQVEDNPQHLTNDTAWAFANDATMGQSDAQLFTVAEQRMSDFKGWKLADIALAFAKTGQSDAQLFNVLARVAERCIGDFKTHGLANLAFAFAKVDHLDAQLFKALANVVEQRMGEFKAQELANTVWAIKKAQSAANPAAQSETLVTPTASPQVQEHPATLTKGTPPEVPAKGHVAPALQLGSTEKTTTDFHAQPGSVERAQYCFKCQQSHAVGTSDFFAVKKFNCVNCGFQVLDEYADKELAQAIRFLRLHACQSQEEAFTHSSLLGWADCTCYNGRYRFSCEDNELVHEYANVVAFFYQRGIPLFHMEALGTAKSRRYCEGVDIVCSSGLPTKEDVASLRERFLTLRLRLMAMVFPQVQPLHVHVYDSTGFSLKYLKWKISLHLVWDDIVVDDTRAAILQQSFIESLEGLSGVPEDEQEFDMGGLIQITRSLQSELLQLGSLNTWRNVIDASFGSGLRVPLCDTKGTGSKDYLPLPGEGRIKEPLGTWQLDPQLSQAVQVVTRHQESNATWVLKGLCRCPEHFPLTAWQEPQLLEPLDRNWQRLSSFSSTIRLRLRKGDHTKIIRAPINVTAQRILEVYTVYDAEPFSWELKLCSPEGNESLFPDTQLCDLGALEPIDLFISQDTWGDLEGEAEKEEEDSEKEDRHLLSFSGDVSGYVQNSEETGTVILTQDGPAKKLNLDRSMRKRATTKPTGRPTKPNRQRTSRPMAAGEKRHQGRGRRKEI